MTFLRTTTLKAAEAPDHPDALTRLRRRELDAIVIEEVLPTTLCERIVEDLEANTHRFPLSSFPPAFKSHFYGMNLNLAEPDLKDYFAAAPMFAESLAGVMGAAFPFEGTVLSTLSAIDGHRPVVAPIDEDGRSFMVTTLRRHDPEGFIPAHFDNEQLRRPSMRALAPLITGDLFSFVLTLSAAERGGVLEVFDAPADRFAAQFENRDRSAPKPDLTTLARTAFNVAAGTMVILRSGAYLHRVTRVEGAARRWTACSFMASARRGDVTYCWG